MKGINQYNKRKPFLTCKGLLVGFIILVLAACGSATTPADTADQSDATTGQEAGPAIAALFAPGGAGSSLVKSAIKKVGFEGGCGESDPHCTCEEAQSVEVSDDHQIQHYLYPQPEHIRATYGDPTDAITHNSEYFCANPETGAENTGMGPDGLGRLAAFELTVDIDGTCVTTTVDDTGDVVSTATSEISMLAGSYGLWRNTDDYEPEVYATFDLALDGEALGVVNCTLFIESEDDSGDNEAILSASCSYADGTPIEDSAFVSSECSVD